MGPDRVRHELKPRDNVHRHPTKRRLARGDLHHLEGRRRIGGSFERVFATRVVRGIYADERERLNAYARQRAAPDSDRELDGAQERHSSATEHITVLTRAGTDPRHSPGSESRASTGTRLAHRPRRQPVNDLAAGPARVNANHPAGVSKAKSHGSSRRYRRCAAAGSFNAQTANPLAGEDLPGVAAPASGQRG